MADDRIVSLNLESMSKGETVAIVDAGGHLAQTLARKVRELKVYSEVISPETPLESYYERGYKSVLVVGSMLEMAPEDVPYPDGFWDLELPILAIGDPALALAKYFDTDARYPSGVSEEEIAREAQDKEIMGRYVAAHFSNDIRAFDKYDESPEVIVHNFRPLSLSPQGPWEILGVTSSSLIERSPREDKIIPVLAYHNEELNRYGVLYHPELSDAKGDERLIKRFLLDVSGVAQNWDLEDHVESLIENIRKVIGEKKALCAFSGGIDSAVAALMVHRAIGKNLSCIFVDTGLMRKDEVEDVESIFGESYQMNLHVVHAEERFLSRLHDVVDPEEKRKIIGEEFIRVFEEEARSIGEIDFLVQGTIYPDVIESGFTGQALVKSHHNVGGLPDDIDFKGIIEPLRDFFKLEVRRVGAYLGLPEQLVWRQPFPGPGLAVRCMGSLTRARLDVLRDADAIFREEIYEADLHRDIQQYFAVLTNVHSVGVRNGERSYEEICAIRAVRTVDFMTARWVPLPYELLDRVSERIIDEVPGINRVVYDITSKPPATIEWE